MTGLQERRNDLWARKTSIKASSIPLLYHSQRGISRLRGPTSSATVCRWTRRCWSLCPVRIWGCCVPHWAGCLWRVAGWTADGRHRRSRTQPEPISGTGSALFAEVTPLTVGCASSAKSSGPAVPRAELLGLLCSMKPCSTGRSWAAAERRYVFTTRAGWTRTCWRARARPTRWCGNAVLYSAVPSTRRTTSWRTATRPLPANPGR